MSNRAYLVEVKSATKSFGPTNVLKGLDFAVAAGEVHALLGGNGAGKSTLIKIITGSESLDGGELLYQGRGLDGSGDEKCRANTIAVVHQELALLPHLTVAENIAIPHHRHGAALFNQEAAYCAAIEALSLIDRDFALRSARRLVGDLSLHERQMVEIARVLSSGAQLLLLDEPTANLMAAESERLFEVIRRLTHESGIGVVFVSHRMREIRQIADVCTIIRDGRSAINRVPIASLTDAEIVERMGQDVTAEPANRTLKSPKSVPSRDRANGDRGLRLERDGLALDITAGGILGLAGAPAGPSALIDALIGAQATKSWSFRGLGWLQGFRSPRQAARNGVGYVSGDRGNKGMLASLPIVDNMMAAERVVGRRVFVHGSEIAGCRSLLQALAITASSLWALPASLSGGTQQKLLIARWIHLKPALLVLEEPTRGVDIGTKRDIYDLIRKMSAEGTTVVWWSTENVELIELCDTILAFNPDGAPTRVLRGSELTEEQLADATGMAA